MPTFSDELKNKFDTEILPMLSGKIYGADGKKLIHDAQEKWHEMIESSIEPDNDIEINYEV